MKTKPSSFGIAILAATVGDDGWCQLLPQGVFVPVMVGRSMLLMAGIWMRPSLRV